jgi:hypothetical protein
MSAAPICIASAAEADERRRARSKRGVERPRCGSRPPSASTGPAPRSRARQQVRHGVIRLEPAKSREQFDARERPHGGHRSCEHVFQRRSRGLASTMSGSSAEETLASPVLSVASLEQHVHRAWAAGPSPDGCVGTSQFSTSSRGRGRGCRSALRPRALRPGSARSARRARCLTAARDTVTRAQPGVSAVECQSISPPLRSTRARCRERSFVLASS